MFFDAFKNCLKKYFIISGRASRKEFWCFFAINAVFALCGTFFSFSYSINNASMDVFISSIFFIINIALIIPLITVACRRLHDVDKSAGWIFFILIPVVGQVFFFIWMLTPGMDKENRYGVIYEKPQKRLY